MRYNFVKNTHNTPCFQCNHLDDVIPICNAIVLAMYINDEPGYVTAYDEFGAYVHMATTADVPELFASVENKSCAAL